MTETHPFEPFVPPNAKYLILGSFTGRQAVKGIAVTDESYDWYYGTQRNQFWPILEAVYGLELKSILAKQALFTRLGIAIADIIYQCERKDGNNLDNNLINIVYNVEAITEILEKNQIKRIFFTSRFVESRFKRHFKQSIGRFPGIEWLTLPSPSPRYARLSKEQKIARYMEILPKY